MDLKAFNYVTVLIHNFGIYYEINNTVRPVSQDQVRWKMAGLFKHRHHDRNMHAQFNLEQSNAVTLTKLTTHNGTNISIVTDGNRVYLR